MSDLECFLADTVFGLHEFPNHDFWHANSLRAAKTHHTHSAHIHACLAPGPDTPFDCKCTSASAALLASRPAHTHMLILSHHPCRVPPSSHVYPCRAGPCSHNLGVRIVQPSGGTRRGRVVSWSAVAMVLLPVTAVTTVAVPSSIVGRRHPVTAHVGGGRVGG